MRHMAARTLSLATHEIDFLKETLHAQQELLQKLYNELDVERESSSIAADEALSMILRLQGEKSAMGMEASQYKRIAEEKMCHAQETLEIFQELIYQKEMQIASLEFQVQAYKFKLLSMGCDDLGVCEMQYPENMLRKTGISEESSSRSSLRRNSSLPPLPVNGDLSRRSSSEGTKSTSSSPQPFQEGKGAESSTRREQADFNSYWEEIMKLDERVKELKNLKGCSPNDVPLTSTFAMRDPSPENSPAKSDFFESTENMVSVQACQGSPSSTSVQDIFEVPVCSYDDQSGSANKKENGNLTIESEKRNGKLDLVWDEIWKSDVKDRIVWEKKPLLSPDSNKGSPKENEAEEKIDWEKKPLLSSGGSNESPKPKYGKADKSLLFKHPTIGVADFELQQFNRRLKQLEDQRFVRRIHETNAETAEEDLRVLLEIRDKVDSLQTEITSWRAKKPLPPESRSPGCLKEVILCFWP